MPALSCIDDLAGDAVEDACEKALFGTPDATAAAVSYAASEISRLRSFGDVTAANGVMSPELQALRRAVERDRYGLVAHVLVVRDSCQPSNCAAFQSLTDHNQVAANMQERIYEGLVSRYASSWNMPASTTDAAMTGMPALASVPTGKPTDAEFPTSASIPPVNIMTPEPPAGAAPSPPPVPPSTTAQAVPAATSSGEEAGSTKAAPKATPVRTGRAGPSYAGTVFSQHAGLADFFESAR